MINFSSLSKPIILRSSQFRPLLSVFALQNSNPSLNQIPDQRILALFVTKDSTILSVHVTHMVTSRMSGIRFFLHMPKGILFQAQVSSATALQTT